MDFARIGLVAPLPALAVGWAGPAPSSAAEVAAPALTVSVVADGLNDVWDVAVLPDGRALVTERDGRIVLLSGTRAGATATPVDADLADVYARGEGGLMGTVAYPDFATSRRFTTCQTHAEGGRPVDIRLVTWELSADGRSAAPVKDPLVGGLPINPSGQHSGCRADGALLVGIGDTARGELPQDRASLSTSRPATRSAP
jgi:glucose/arabinose dehydrogenase